MTNSQIAAKVLSTFDFLDDFRAGHSWTEVAVSLAGAAAIPTLLWWWYRSMSRLYGREK